MQSHDEKLNKIFFLWLLISFSLVFLIVIVGGLTRLTDSGLSITEWELLKGIFIPNNKAEWNEYFDQYKKIPQYSLLNNNMTIDEFKVIFYWEYFHRILGRIIGLFFLIPLIFFYIKKNVHKKYIKVCFIILSLIFLQGAIGWFMVASGLTNNVSVSHYRLSLHLFNAFIIISMIFWLLLNLNKNTYKTFFLNKKNNYYFYFLIFLIFIQIIFGAFVSGLDAGKIYQTWPLMNYTYFPNDVTLSNYTDFFDFNNQSLVQFYHRNIAYLILVYFIVLGYFIFKIKLKRLFKPYYIVSFFLLLQVLLGIFTLISGINIYMASAHQICSLLLVLSVINLYYNYIN